MALSSTPSLTEINTELGVTGKSLSECISLAGKTGTWTKQSDFAGYTADSISASPSSFNVDYNLQTVSTTITSSSDWEVESQPAFVTQVNPTTGSSGTSVNITVANNLDGVDRIGYVVFRLISNTSVKVNVLITQSA